jgi:integrase
MSTDVRVELAERAVAGSPAYRSAWKAFGAWCRAQQRSALPAAPETLLAYVTYRYRVERRAAATLDVAACAVVRAHDAAGLPSPASKALRALVMEARRRAPRRASVELDEVRAVVGACGEDETGLRDRALLLCVHHGRLSRVGAIRLNIEHLNRPVLVALHQRHPEPLLCPVLALERWLAARGNPSQGPLFVSVHAGRFGGRLYPGDVHRVLCQRCDAAGIRRLTVPVFRRSPLPSSPHKEPCL